MKISIKQIESTSSFIYQQSKKTRLENKSKFHVNIISILKKRMDKTQKMAQILFNDNDISLDFKRNFQKIFHFIYQHEDFDIETCISGQKSATFIITPPNLLILRT